MGGGKKTSITAAGRRSASSASEFYPSMAARVSWSSPSMGCEW